MATKKSGTISDSARENNNDRILAEGSTRARLQQLLPPWITITDTSLLNRLGDKAIELVERSLVNGKKCPIFCSATSGPVPVRPGISAATLQTAGVRYCDFPDKGSIEIPYFDISRQPINFSRYRLPVQRANG